MKKWQKITGIIVFSLIAIYELLAWANTYVYMKAEFNLQMQQNSD